MSNPPDFVTGELEGPELPPSEAEEAAAGTAEEARRRVH
ncbi:MAG: hypothetical protein H6Q11_129, partial [Acidobacteria bacterium]|nr:hypothetical protein [Acidobacteriota bacterium]